MWSEMSYNKYQDNLSLLQRLEEEVEDDWEYIGDSDESKQANISLLNCD